jgi:hypothetical protein
MSDVQDAVANAVGGRDADAFFQATGHSNAAGLGRPACYCTSAFDPVGRRLRARATDAARGFRAFRMRRLTFSYRAAKT